MKKNIVRRLFSLLLAPSAVCAAAFGVLLALCLLPAGCLPSPTAVDKDVQTLKTTATHAQAARQAQKCPPIGAANAPAVCEAQGDCLHLLSDAGHAAKAYNDFVAAGSAVPSNQAASSTTSTTTAIDAAVSAAANAATSSPAPPPSVSSVVGTVTTIASQQASAKTLANAWTSRRDTAKKQCSSVAGVN